MSSLIHVTSSLIRTTVVPTNKTSNLYKDIIKYLDLPEPLIVAIVAVAVLLFFLLFVLLCSRCCCKKCCGDTPEKDKYKIRKLESKEIDKILLKECDREFKQNFGKIHFSMKYNLTKELLIVKSIRAEELEMSIDGSVDPYVIVQIKSSNCNESKTTKTKLKTENPIFSETFSFKITNGDLIEASIIFKVFDYDKFGADSLLGQITLLMKDINMSSIINTLSEFSKDLQEGEDASSGRGQICLILNNAGEMGLQVTVLEAKNVRIKENSHYSHIFVTVKFRMRLNSKNTKIINKKRTKDCPYTKFPYFNETFLFHKPHGGITDCELSIKLWMSGSFKMPKCVGRILLGSENCESGDIHWQNMLDNPRHPIAKWHVLMNPK